MRYVIFVIIMIICFGCSDPIHHLNWYEFEMNDDIRDGFVQVYSEDQNDSELGWYKNTLRSVFKVKSGKKWRLHIMDRPIQEMKVGEYYHIPRNTYYRLIKGKGNLTLKVKEEERK